MVSALPGLQSDALLAYRLCQRAAGWCVCLVERAVVWPLREEAGSGILVEVAGAA
jgi:hypothetical protein